jgi:hypothetical protein
MEAAQDTEFRTVADVPKSKKRAKPKPKKAKRPKPKKKTARKSKAKAAVVRSERLDMRLTKAEKAKIGAKAKKTRRTVTSLIIEAIEKIR